MFQILPVNILTGRKLKGAYRKTLVFLCNFDCYSLNIIIERNMCMGNPLSHQERGPCNRPTILGRHWKTTIHVITFKICDVSILKKTFLKSYCHQIMINQDWLDFFKIWFNTSTIPLNNTQCMWYQVVEDFFPPPLLTFLGKGQGFCASNISSSISSSSLSTSKSLNWL